MAEKRVCDKSGNILTVLDVDGTWFPRTLNTETLRNIPNIPLNNDDVFLCGCPRSGHHWMFEILSMLLSGSAEYLPHSLESCVLELTPNSSLQTLPSPRILTTHVLPHQFPTDHAKKKVKTVYMIRDPKDVAVSWFYFYHAYPGDPYEGSWDDWLDLFMRDEFLWSTWFDHVKSFEKCASSIEPSLVHIVFYEDLKQYPLRELQKLASFLGKVVSDEILMEILNKCAFQNLKSEKDRKNQDWDKNAQYRKGNVGDWKNIFTAKQDQKFYEIYRQKMKGSALRFHYETCID